MRKRAPALAPAALAVLTFTGLAVVTGNLLYLLGVPWSVAMGLLNLWLVAKSRGQGR